MILNKYKSTKGIRYKILVKILVSARNTKSPFDTSTSARNYKDISYYSRKLREASTKLFL